MTSEKDLLNMIEIVTTAIEIHGNEEAFFRRSSTATTNQPAKSLLLEIANEVAQYREQLELKRDTLKSELKKLEETRKNAVSTQKTK